MAISTMGIFLMKKSTDVDWYNLTDIKAFPDMGGTPDALDVTTLSENKQLQVDGVESSSSLSFTCNYDLDKYLELKKIENVESEFALWIGGERSGDTIIPTGSDGIYSFGGKLFVYLAGGDVNTAGEMIVIIVPTTEINFEYELTQVLAIDSEMCVLAVNNTKSVILSVN